METKQILDLVQRYHENKEFITNEETAKMALVVPFIRALGYDPNKPKEVRLEYKADFVQGDGKKHPDRMDYAIFDQTGQKPLMVIEAKGLGTDLVSKSQQLARYIAQMPDLRFGIMTDGCKYLFYGDLEQPNQMDKKPFFHFSLDDQKRDWESVATFLSKFSRDTFNAETLLTDAENSHYRQAMTEKLITALKDPGNDEGFMKWLVQDIYKGRLITSARTRMSEVAREAVEPALMRMIGDDFLMKLRERIEKSSKEPSEDELLVTSSTELIETDLEENDSATNKIVTTEEELKFHGIIKDICEKAGEPPEEILYKDTVNYFNVSFRRPTKWFIRFFGDTKRKSVVTLIPHEQLTTLDGKFEVEEAPKTFGASRIYIDSIEQIWALEDVVLGSLKLLQEQ